MKSILSLCHQSRLFYLLVIASLLIQLGFITPVQAAADPAPQASLQSATFTSCADVTEIPQAECEALEALYNSTNGASWTDHTNWLQTDTPCDWYGVTCNAGNVVNLTLLENNLSGSIPIEIGDLSSLLWLALSNNQLSGNIPATIGNLSNLQTFHVFHNQLSGNIPSGLGNLHSLRWLGLGFNQLSGDIPTQIWDMSTLTELDLSNNQLSGNIPTEIGNLLSLQKLSLGYNQLSGEIPFQIGTLSNLLHLGLSNNKLTGIIPVEIGNLTQLQDLSLGDNQLTGSIPAALGNLTQLQRLSLGFNQLSGDIPTQVWEVSTLTELFLSNNQLSGNIPIEIGNLLSLQDLSLGYNQLSGEIPTQIGTLSNLRTLHLGDNQLTGIIPVEIGNLTQLQRLSLYDNQLTGSIPAELGNLTQLQRFSLANNQLSGSIPAELGNLTQLTSLDLGDAQLTGSIPAELGNLTQLTILRLWGNQLTGNIPVELGNLTQLTVLYLHGNQLSGEIPSSITNLTGLTTLTLSCGLTSSDPLVIAFLDEKLPGWQAYQCLPSLPKITANLSDNSVEGIGWPLGEVVTLRVHDPSMPLSPDIIMTDTSHAASWDSSIGVTEYDLYEMIDLKPGLILTMSDGNVTKTLTLVNLQVNPVDPATYIVSGIAPAGMQVEVDATDNDINNNRAKRHTLTGPDGHWSVNFSVVGPLPDEQTTVDLMGGSCGSANVSDADGDSTSTVWRTISIDAIPDDYWVWTDNWPLDALLTMRISGPGLDYSAQATVGYSPDTADKSSDLTRALFDIPVMLNPLLQAGDVITITDGITTKAYTVALLQVTNIDVDADTISGIATPGALVSIYNAPEFPGGSAHRWVTADATGYWLANFHIPGVHPQDIGTADLQAGYFGQGRVYDDDGNATWINWRAPNWVPPDTIPLVIGINSDHDVSLPWADADTLTILDQLFEPLYRIDGDGTFMPAAATQYTVSPDGLVYTVTLRDMVWSDGMQVTAQYYVDGLLRLLDPASGYDSPSLYYPIAGAKDYNQGLTGDPNDVGLRALDAHTLEITLESPTAYFPQILAFPSFLPVRLDLIAQYGEAWMEPENFVGNGPYLLIEHDPDHFLLESNPTYYDHDQVQFNQIGFAVISDDNERLDAYRRGDIDALWTFPRYEYQNIINDPVLSQDIDISNQPGIQYLGLNVDRYPTDNALVRKALASAIDREYLINTVIGAYWHTQATGVIPPELFGYQGDAVGYIYDEAQAQAYLEQAGFPGGTGFPEIKLISNTGHEDIVEYIAQQWRDVLGIPVRLEYFEWSYYLSMLNDCRADPASCVYNVYRLGWFVDYTDPNNILADLFGPDSSWQFTGWDNLRYRELLQLSLSEMDPAQRLEHIHGAEKILVEDEAAILPLYFTDRLSLIKPGIQPCFGLSIAHLNLWGTICENHPPVADAGGLYTVYASGNVTLDASASSDLDGDTLTYEWDLDYDGQYDDASGVTITTSFNQIGDRTIGLRVTDDGGLSDTDTATVTVLPWTLKGFYQPVDMNGVYNIAKNGSTVPFKFEIFAGATELIDIAYIKGFTSSPISCTMSAVTDDVELTATGGTSLRYDAAAGQFVYNWKTPKTAGKCYRVTMTTIDGSSLVAYFKLK